LDQKTTLGDLNISHLYFGDREQVHLKIELLLVGFEAGKSAENPTVSFTVVAELYILDNLASCNFVILVLNNVNASVQEPFINLHQSNSKTIEDRV
jgi:hypothetical protein